MNRLSYRLVFNRSLGALVAVAECARGRGKSSASGARGATATAALLGGALLASPVWAELPVAATTFATYGQAGTQLSGNQLLVNQVGNKSILNWQKFNISAGAGVQFRQVNNLTDNQLVSGASFTSLNRIWDINPSVIAGSITQGAGQKANIILVNSNGIAFMGGSQVNLNSFTATTLNMADQYVTDRLLGDPTSPQFAGALDGTEARGFVKVFEGANITADSQGRVMLIAPTVVNRGNITAPDGQVILAAGTKAYLRTDDTSNNLELRGLLVEVDSSSGLADFVTDNTSVADGELDGQAVSLRSATDDKLGHATNFGTLSSARGNVTMVGYAVNQNGIARATSSVVANGSVYLMAQDSYTDVSGNGKYRSVRFGQVVMGKDSLTEVLPETDDTTTSVDGTTGTGQAAPSEVRVLGNQIYMADGATIRVPAGEVSLSATNTYTELLGGLVRPDSGDGTARIHLAQGATIDVSGLVGVDVSAGRNTVEVELRGDELKDSPVNQTGPLRGETAWVDIQQALENAEAGVDTLIAQDSLEAYAAKLERTIAERSTAGGQVVLDSAGSVIVENGATINLSGGSIDYQQATVKTTVLSSSGQLVDLADAVASTRYDAIASEYTIDYGRWNKTETIELPNAQRVVRGYTDGQDAGSLTVFAQNDVYLQPTIVGTTIAGERQVASGNLARGAQVYLGGDSSGQGALGGNILNANVVIDRSTLSLPAGFGLGSELPEALRGTVTIDADLLAEGRVAELSVITTQAAEVRSALRAPAGGTLDISAGGSIQVGADIVSAGGSIALEAASVAVADGVTLSTAGTWVNRLTDASGVTTAPVLDGGEISITANSTLEAGEYLIEGTISLGQGVRIDAGGGALLTEKGGIQDGAGGSISLDAYALSGLESASLSAYGLNEGGSLSITTRDITIGGAAPATAVAGDLHLDAGFFAQGGFASYTLQALENLEVADNTAVRPVVAHRNLNADFRQQASGASLASITTTGVRDLLQRESADISLTALERATDTGDLRIGEGASIEVDPGASIILSARKRLAIEGSLVAHGGDVTASLLARLSNGFDNGSAQGNLFLGDNAVIDVSGVALTQRDSKGLLQGEVLAGGSVALLAETGALVTRSGSEINVSGAGPVTLGERNESGGLGRVVASDAGSLSLRGASLYLDGGVQAHAGSATQSGGTLVVGSEGDVSVPDSADLLSSIVVNLELHNQLAAQADELTDQTDLVRTRSLRVATDALEQAGFNRLQFSSSDGIVLADGLDLGRAELRELQLDAARIVTQGDARLSADALRLGNYLEGNRVGSAGDATNHGGVLTATGRLLELAGDLRLQGMDLADLTGSELLQLSGVTHRAVEWTDSSSFRNTGDYQHSALIQSTGDLTLRGGVVAPGGFADVQIQAAGRDVRIESSGATPIVPLSALGSLSIEAQNITQAGYLVAPFGQISLNATGDLVLAAGSVTSVAGTPGQVLPLGQLLNGIEWQVNLDPTNTTGLGQTTLDELPGKELRLSGASITMEAAADGQSAATVNVSGGGDLQAYEFTAGPGGSRDILTDANTYAIIPGYQSGFAPDDAQESTGLAVGTAIYLKGVDGLADGKYVLLPAHYALLPGAMAVRLNGDTVPTVGTSQTRQDGIQVVAGYLTDSRSNATRSGDWVGVQVLTQEQVKARSEFTVALASNFFADAGSTPQDAGLLSLTTQGQLVLGASIQGTAASGGQGMAVDISAPNLLVASGDVADVPEGTTVLDVDQLSALGARSLLLGATREKTEDGTELTVSASTVTLDNDAGHALAASEVMLAALDTVTLTAGSLIDAQGADGDAGAYTTEGNGAFVRAASTSATFTRSGSPDRSTGVLNGASDAVIQAAKSIAVDATQANDFAGQTLFNANGETVAGELSIGATRISFGQPATLPEGLTLDPDALAALQDLQSLTLTSYSSFDLYDGAEVGGVDANGVPLLGKLTLEGGGLTGLENEGMTASLRARELTLNNTAGVSASLPPTQQTLGSGTLNIVADTLTLGAGDKTIDGYSVVNISATEVVAAGAGTTRINAQTQVATDRLTGGTGASQTLDTGEQALSLARLDSGATLANSTALGASWTLQGASVALDTAVTLHSGALNVVATSGDLTLGAGTDIDVSGLEVGFFNTTQSTWGGEVTLIATAGNVVVAGADSGAAEVAAAAAESSGARINVSGAAGADGGTLTASAVNGDVDLSGATLVGQTTADADGNLGAGARVRVDAQNVSDFSAFNAALNDGGFSGERTVRTRSANGLTVAQGDVVQADTVNLTADGGALVVEGTVSASGSEGGSVALYGQSVTLTGTAHVEARANTEDGQGGRVEIGAATQVSEAAAGNIDLQEGSTIDVSGSGGGTVHLRAQRKGTGVAVTALDSTITGASEVNLEAVKVYNKTSNLTLNVSTTDSGTTLGLTKINSDNTSYATNYTAIETALGQADNAAFHMLSGVEIRSSGNITLGADWNLVNSAAGGEAGVLTLRAGGNLAINNNLSDGFVNATAAYPTGSTPLQASTVRGGRSWGYNLVAGADVSSANVMATLASEDKGDITVAAGKLVRTGTGDIRMAAGRDITLASATSVVYTAGTASPALSGVTAPATAQRAYFTQGGGDVTMAAARDIVASVASSQLWSDWLYRQGRLDEEGDAYAASEQGQLAWWVRFDRFAQGVGALGGGDVHISAGRDVSNLSASAPTQGRMSSVTPDASALVRTGGGDVTVEAGNDILSGQYYADNGNIRLVAGAAVASGRDVNEQPVYTVLALGDGQATVRATGDVNIGAVVNPTLVVQDYGTSDGNNIGTTTTRAQRTTLFSTYGDDSGVSLASLLGDTVLHQNLTAAASAYPVLSSVAYQNDSNYGTLLSYLPPSLSMTAFTGDVAVNGDALLLPSGTGQLELLAQGSVDLKGQIILSDADPSQVASITRPTNNPLLVLGQTHATTPVHTGDTSTAKVYAVNGDVSWSGDAGTAAAAIDSSKALEVRAGRDVTDFSVVIQHANASDRSVVQAGRDVSFAANATRTESAGIRIGGLGTLEVTAGRDVNLGTSGGILSRGDLDNNNLPVGGASIQVMAGVGAAGLDATATLERLAERVAAGTASDTDLWLVRWLVGNDNLSAAEAPAAVASVLAQDDLAQSNQVRDMLFTALRETGRAANEADSGYANSFDRGYAAMELVFPGISTQDADGNFTGYEGSINLFASRINTARGGDISFLVPGGGMVVGLANTPSVLTTLGVDSPGPLGVVASSSGDISGATRDDMLVNQSRILTVGGGDILLWSSEGDLDAGKGKKTATTVPPPVIRVATDGTVTQELQGAASGSGIGALSTNGVTAGDVDLIAPKGTVNAGDAGIRAGNLNIAAQVVLGADNISVSGTSTGTPVADTSAVTAASSGATTGGDDTGSVVESLNQAAADSAKAAQELAESLRPYVVRVDVLGYGN